MSDQTHLRMCCRICGQPVNLDAETVTDEDGKAVHEDCYVRQITGVDAAQEEMH